MRWLAKCGVYGLVAALVMILYTGHAGLAAWILIVVGIVDIVLEFIGWQTVSHWLWRRFGFWEDKAMLASELAAIWTLRGLHDAVLFTLGVVAGHIHWQDKGGADA